MSQSNISRGHIWFNALAGVDGKLQQRPASTLASNVSLNGESSLFLAVIPDLEARFPCARDGQVGLEEAYALARHIWKVIEDDKAQPPSSKRPIIAIVDVKSQAYGRREETAAIFLAAAAAADAYGSARMAGHPVVTLVAGHAFSGGFLTHGYQANRILAFDDAGVVIHAMHKEAAARVTMRSVAELDQLAHKVIPMSYSVGDYAKLGLIYRLVHANDPVSPTKAEVESVRAALLDAVADARGGSFDLSSRWTNESAAKNRRAGIAVRALMETQWKLVTDAPK